MKYRIKQRVKDPVSGIMREKVVTIDGEIIRCEDERGEEYTVTYTKKSDAELSGND